MKLGLLLDTLPGPGGGAERHSAALLVRARTAGHQVLLATLDARPGALDVPAVCIRAPRARPERDEVFGRRGLSALRDAGCDVVLAVRHVPDCDVYLPHGGLAAEARQAWDRARGGVSFVRQVARRFSRKQDYFLAAERALLSGVEGPLVVALSHRLRQAMLARHPRAESRIVVIPNGCDVGRFRPGAQAEARARLRAALGWEGQVVALLLARHPVLKGAATAVDALLHPRVQSLDPPLALLVAGGPLPRALRRRARALGHRFAHWPAPQDPAPLYGMTDLLLHPTYYDPCSLVTTEALAAGVPVITTPANGAGEIMGMRGGIVVEEAGNATSLAVALGVLHDERLRRLTGEDAREIAERNTWEERLDQVIAVCSARAHREGRGMGGDVR